MRLSVLFAGFVVLAASILTYAAPYGTPQTFLDIEQRSSAEQHTPHVTEHTGVASTSGAVEGSSDPPSPGREVVIITRALAGSTESGSPPFNVFKHWAVLVGTRYYELYINNEVPNEEACSRSLHGANIRMNVVETGGTLGSQWKKKYHKGSTHHTDEEIHEAGSDVMRVMSAKNYHIINNNCQDFATKLAKCIVSSEPKKRCVVQ